MISYKLLDDSQLYYNENGFSRIEVPWTVSEYIDDITKPKEKIHLQLKHNDKCLIGSGEQGFLYLYLKNFLPKGRFQTITPCFRDDRFDFYHSKCFMKNELIDTNDVSYENLLNIVNCSKSFFEKYVKNVDIIKTKDGFDLECNGVELGSYGIRECEFLKWIYGTGCAEPRFSNIILKQ